MADARIIRVFVSSPGDVAEERAVLGEVVTRINDTDGQRDDFRLELWKWEDAIPQIGPDPQTVIDDQTPTDYEIYVGILAHRFGTPTGKFGSGTEKEFHDAVERWKLTKRPWILLYFKKQMIDPATLDLQQYQKVLEFQQGVQSQGLYKAYEGVDGRDESFARQVELHLRKIVPQVIKAPELDEPIQDGTKPTIPQSYLDWLQRQCANIDLLGLRLKEGRSLRLNNVYVPLTTESKLLLDQLDKESLHVSGDPGSGKSTFCRWAAWLACQKSMPLRETSEPDKYRESYPSSFVDRLPLMVRLRDFWPFLPHDDREDLSLNGLEESLKAWFDEKKLPDLEWPNIRRHLELGTALIIFDGLDEVPISKNDPQSTWHPRSLLISGLTEAVAEWYRRDSYHHRNKDKDEKDKERVPPPNRVLITSRPYGLPEVDRRKLELSHAPIEDLTRPLKELLVRRWFSILSEDAGTGDKLADDMLTHLRGRKGIEDLQANPMLLTAMCIIYYEGKRLPEDRCDLYDRIVDTVLFNRFKDPKKLELVRNELRVVAHTMHTGFHLGEQRTTPQAQVTYDEIDRTLEAYRQQQRWTHAGFEDVVTARENLLSQTGLLLSRGDDTAAFYHLSIQEFLAAERLWLEKDLAGVILKRSEDANWRNTLSFLFGTQLNKRSEPDCSITLLETLIEQCRADQPGLLLVIADCVGVLRGKGIKLTSQRVDEFGRRCVTAIEHEEDLQPRHVWCLELGRIGDPRIVTDLRDPAAYVEIPAGTYVYQDGNQQFKKPFLLSRYPVTNSQYELFIKENGYFQREFWSQDGWKWREEIDRTEPFNWQNAKWNAPNKPVVAVTFWEAEAFCKWAKGELPSEKQWEAAARGLEGGVYPWGNEWADGICNSSAARLGVTSPVGLFPRSRSLEFGLEDMAGNVWEWCQEEHENQKGRRVLRGGSFSSVTGYCRSAFRFNWRPDARNLYPGFRVSRTHN